MEKNGATLLTVEQLRRDGGTQTRAQLSDDHIADLAAALEGGAELPSVVVFHDGRAYWLADGFHRVAAHEKADRLVVRCDVRQGTQRDAVLFSVGANATHGLPRTNKDKRRAVEKLIGDSEWSKWSDREIAKVCGVTHPFVASVRGAQLETVTSSEEPETRIGADGKVRRLPHPKAPKYETPEPQDIGADFDNYVDEPESTEDQDDTETEDHGEPAPPPPSAPRQRAPEPPAAHREPPDEDPREVGYPRASDREPTPLEVARAAWERMSHEERALFLADVHAVEVATLERLRAQRDQDRELGMIRNVARMTREKFGATHGQRIIDFVLDGGDLSLARLGLDYSVTREELASVYKAASLRAHPDRGGAPGAQACLNADRALVFALLDDSQPQAAAGGAR